LHVVAGGPDDLADGRARRHLHPPAAGVNPAFRNYRIPAFPDIPHTEVSYADTRDALGSLGAKGMGECPINPVAPALANALADAASARFRDLPFTPDREHAATIGLRVR
jgi:CO/xanthine dehydrogenase Mo-binding subunit